MDRSGVRFGVDEAELTSGRVEVVVPRRVRTKRELLEILDRGLQLPGYFGYNWDALHEVLRDFSWLPPGQVVIRHEDVPLDRDEEEQSKYLYVLSDAASDWIGVKDRDLLIVFPREDRKNVEDRIYAYRKAREVG